MFVHSLTKYASGTGDVMGGAVIARSELIRALRTDFGVLGGTLDPHAAFLILRGLKTYFVRYQAQSASAGRASPQHLAGAPGGGARALPGAADAIRSTRSRRGRCRTSAPSSASTSRAARRRRAAFVDTLQLFALTASLGSTESLVMTPQMMGGRELNAEQQRMSGITEGTVRLSIGLEDPDDLVEDLGRALDAAGS